MKMRKLSFVAVVLLAAVVSGETVDIAVETVRQGGARAVENVKVEVTDGTARFVWPRARIPSDAVCVSVKPAFSVARKGEEGYYVTPSGALCTFRLDNCNYAIHKNWFPMPVYGMKTPRTAFVAIVTGMKYDFSLVANAKKGVYSCFISFDMDVAHAYEDIAVDYVFLSGGDADYSGMARAYRRHQLARGACRPIAERARPGSRRRAPCPTRPSWTSRPSRPTSPSTA